MPPPPPALLDASVGYALGVWAAARLHRPRAGAPRLHAAVLASAPLVAALRDASGGGTVEPLLLAEGGGGSAAATASADLVLIWTAALPTPAQLARSLLALRPGGALVLPATAAHDEHAHAHSAAAWVRARVAAAKAAGAREYGTCPVAPPAGATDALLRAVGASAGELGVALVASSETIDSLVDLTGLADAPPSARALASVSALLDIDAAALAARNPAALGALVDELRALSLYNAAPARAAPADERSVAARPVRAAARVHVHVPLHCMVLQRLAEAPTSPDGAGAAAAARVGGSGGGGDDDAMQLEAAPRSSLSSSSPWLAAPAGSFDEPLPPGCEYVAAPPPSRLRPLQLLLAEPGVARKLADGSASSMRDHLGLVQVEAREPPPRQHAPPPPPPPPPPAEWVALDVCFPLGEGRSFFPHALAQWQCRRLAWTSGRAWHSPAAAASGSPRRRTHRAHATAAAAAPAGMAPGPVDSGALQAGGAPSGDADADALHELLARHEFTSLLSLPRTVGLPEMVSTLVSVWDAALAEAGGAPRGGDHGAGSSSSGW